METRVRFILQKVGKSTIFVQKRQTGWLNSRGRLLREGNLCVYKSKNITIKYIRVQNFQYTSFNIFSNFWEKVLSKIQISEIYIYLYLSLYIYIYLSVYLYLSIYIYLSTYLSIYLSSTFQREWELDFCIILDRLHGSGQEGDFFPQKRRDYYERTVWFWLIFVFVNPRNLTI